MARFYVTGHLDSSRNSDFKAGGRHSISDVHVRGWSSGVEVDTVKLPDGGDAFDIYLTPGSSGAGHRVLIGRVKDMHDGEGAALVLATDPGDASGIVRLPE